MKRAILLAATFLPATAFADQPVGDPRFDIAYSAAQQASGANVYVLPASSISRCIKNTDLGSASSVCEWVSMRSLVVLESQSGELACVASMTSTLTLGASGGAYQLAVQPYGVTTRWVRNTAGVRLSTAQRRDQVITPEVMQRVPGNVFGGICTVGGLPRPVNTIDGSPAYLGCRVGTDADCTDQVSGSACTATTDTTRQLLRDAGAVTFVCRGAAGSEVLAVSVER